MALRWIPYSRVSMQRAGVLIAVTAAAHDTRPTSLEGIAASYAAPRIRRHVRIPDAARDDVSRYFRQLRLWERYPSVKRGEPLAADFKPELQDLWLADPQVPSATGAITDQVIDEPPQLAASMRLIRPNNFSRTDRGRALMALLSDDERRAAAPDASDRAPSENLFRLSLGVQGFLAYVLLDADFDFVQVAYNTWDRTGKFTRADFADRLVEACEALRRQWVRRARSGAERRLLARLESWQTKLEEIRKKGGRKGGRDWGGGRTPDQMATVRLEPYVDFGLVTRTRRNVYEYELKAGQRAFFDEVVAAEDAGDFLSHRFFASALPALGFQPQQIDDAEIWDRVKGAHARLKSALGFASFEEVMLLAIGQLVNETNGSRYFEVGDGLRVMRERQQSEPRRIRFGVRRGGGLTYLKIVEGAKDG